MAEIALGVAAADVADFVFVIEVVLDLPLRINLGGKIVIINHRRYIPYPYAVDYLLWVSLVWENHAG